MNLRATLASFTLGSLSLFAFADDSSEQTRKVMNQHQEEIKNQIADVEYNRRQVVERNIQLAPAEAEAFWGIYNNYRAEADKLASESIALEMDFADALRKGSVGEDQARQLQARVFQLEDKNQKLKETYVEQIAKEVSPVRALRFLQIETQLDAIALIQTNRAMPLAQ